MKTAYILIAITSNAEYIERRDLSIYQCVAHLMKAREAAALVAAKHPSVVVKYECRAT
jgi:hypothetical protein